MSYSTRITPIKFGEPRQDGSIAVLGVEDGGATLVAVYEYSSEIIPVFRCANEDTVQYFVFRFSHTLDSWYDAFTVGPIAKFTLKHRSGDDGDDSEVTSEIDLGFAGWAVVADESNTLYTDVEAAFNRMTEL